MILPTFGRFTPIAYDKRNEIWERAKAPLDSWPLFGPSKDEAVNAWVNHNVPYVPDTVDYWQSAAETVKRQAGDCEDLAILKRALLLLRGEPTEAMYLIVGYDKIMRCGHAMLWLHGEVLDNLVDHPVEAGTYGDMFQPYIAYGDKHSFLYGTPTQ